MSYEFSYLQSLISIHQHDVAVGGREHGVSGPSPKESMAQHVQHLHRCRQKFFEAVEIGPGPRYRTTLTIVPYLQCLICIAML